MHTVNLNLFEPYNSNSCIDSLMEYLLANNISLSNQSELEVMLRIRKLKVQLYFKEKLAELHAHSSILSTNMLKSQEENKLKRSSC